MGSLVSSCSVIMPSEISCRVRGTYLAILRPSVIEAVIGSSTPCPCLGPRAEALVSSGWVEWIGDEAWSRLSASGSIVLGWSTAFRPYRSIMGELPSTDDSFWTALVTFVSK